MKVKQFLPDFVWCGCDILHRRTCAKNVVEMDFKCVVAIADTHTKNIFLIPKREEIPLIQNSVAQLLCTLCGGLLFPRLS